MPSLRGTHALRKMQRRKRIARLILLAEPDEQIAWVVEGLLPAGGLSALVAKSKVGKSTLARCIALAVARGEPFLDRATTKGAVLYLALEESRRQVKAHFEVLGATDADKIHVYAGRAPVEALLELRAAVSEYRPTLVVIDTLFRLTRVKDANDYAQVITALDPLLAVARELGVHVLVLHHSPKGDPRQTIDAALGSTAIAGTVDTMIVLRRTDRFRTLVTEQREGEGFPEEVTLDFDPETRWVFLGPSRKTADEAEAAAAIVEWLKTKAEPVDESAIHEWVEGRKVTKQRAIRQLVEEGKVGRTGAGKKGNPYLYATALERPAVEPSDLSDSLAPHISWEPENQKSRSPENSRNSGTNSDSRDSAPFGKVGNQKLPPAAHGVTAMDEDPGGRPSGVLVPVAEIRARRSRRKWSPL